MAQELALRDGGTPVKIRSPWAVALLPIITLGVYHLVWWYRVNRELRDFGRAKGYDLGQNPTASILALFPGAIVVIPALVTYWRGTKRVQGAARIAGREPQVNGWIALILYVLLAPAFWAYLQVGLSDVWRSQAEPRPGQPLPPAPEVTMPPRLGEQPERPAGSQWEPPAPER
jgi:uncharacterized protein DUF4234